MQLDLIGDFADQVRVESFQNVRDVLHFFETALLAVQFFNLILETDDLLFHFLFFAQVGFSELDKLIVFSGELIGLVFEFGEFLVDFVFFHFEDFGGEGVFDLLVEFVDFEFGVFIFELNIFVQLFKLIVVILKRSHAFHLISSNLRFHFFHELMLKCFERGVQ